MNSQRSLQFFLVAIVCAVAVATDPKCSKNPGEGTGQERTVKFSYNPQLGYCTPFFRKGNCSDGNCFDSDVECLKSCSAEYQASYPEGDAVCALEMNPGSCFASILMYYYDREEKTCRIFLYRGCHGNGNRFETKEACQKTCQAKSGRILGSPDAPNPDEQTVNVGLIVGVLGGIVFAVAAIAAIVLLVTQRKAKRSEMKKVPTTDIEMS
ncbi:inter-alpha-trypsin inhibitor [Hoplias malabaricus]|uniref:inter-alpha-trypsin inhibitor n=1 Tax=Hoplias malabaricus TaxID=27720 RepID=UPI003462B4A3